MLDIAELILGELYAGYAGLVYWQLRTSRELQAEIAETRSWVRCTPPWHLFASWLLPAMPLIAEVTCFVNGLLWPWRWSPARGGPHGRARRVGEDDRPAVIDHPPLHIDGGKAAFISSICGFLA